MAAKQISVEDTRKLRELNSRVGGHLQRGDYEAAEPPPRKALRELHEHINRMLDTKR